MLIVEGTDKVGKTTLCAKLLEALRERKCPVTGESSKPPPPGWDYYWGYIPSITANVVMDRFVMSELCYGEAARDGSGIGPETYRLLDADMREYGAVTVVIVADDAWLDRQLEKERDVMFGVDAIKSVNRLFRSAGLHQAVLSRGKTWKVDADFVYDMSREPLFPAENPLFVDQVVTAWMTRRKHLSGIGCQPTVKSRLMVEHETVR